MIASVPLALSNDWLDLTTNLVLLFLVVLWIALIYYTYSDARRRIADPMLVCCATAASLFPFAGTIVYMIVRPPEFLEDARERDLRRGALGLELPHERTDPLVQQVVPEVQHEGPAAGEALPAAHGVG